MLFRSEPERDELSSNVNQMAGTLNLSCFNNRDSLLGPNIKQGDIISRTSGLNNHGLVCFQWQVRVQNTLHWQSMRNLTYILGFWLGLLLMCSPFFFFFLMFTVLFVVRTSAAS